MKRLIFRFVSPTQAEKMKFVLNIQRDFRSVIIDFIKPDTMEDISHILEHGAEVRELKIVNCFFDDPMYLKSIFESMPLLEKIYLNGVMIKSNIEIPAIHFQNLVKLDVIECSAKVI